MDSRRGGSGIPGPEELGAYEKAVAGAGERLLRMVENAQQHSQSMDVEELKIARRGQICALLIALSFLAVAAILVGTGHDVAGTIIGSIDLVALVTVFILGQKTQPRDQGQRQSMSRESMRRMAHLQFIEEEIAPGRLQSSAHQTNDEQSPSKTEKVDPKGLPDDPSVEEEIPFSSTQGRNPSSIVPLELSEEDREFWRHLTEEDPH